jgi:hypothetical protein
MAIGMWGGDVFGMPPPLKAFSVALGFLYDPFITLLPRNTIFRWVAPSRARIVSLHHANWFQMRHCHPLPRLSGEAVIDRPPVPIGQPNALKPST